VTFIKNLCKNHHFTLSWCDFQVPKCTKFKIFRSSAPDPAGELTALPQTPSWWGECSLPLTKNPSPALDPSGLESRPFRPRTQPTPLLKFDKYSPAGHYLKSTMYLQVHFPHFLRNFCTSLLTEWRYATADKLRKSHEIRIIKYHLIVMFSLTREIQIASRRIAIKRFNDVLMSCGKLLIVILLDNMTSVTRCYPRKRHGWSSSAVLTVTYVTSEQALWVLDVRGGHWTHLLGNSDPQQFDHFGSRNELIESCGRWVTADLEFTVLLIYYAQFYFYVNSMLYLYLCDTQPLVLFSSWKNGTLSLWSFVTWCVTLILLDS